MINFLKGIIIGIGGIAPGLSGSVMLVIFGLYDKTISAIGNLFKDIKNNVKFLFPLLIGFGVGILLFSKIIDFFINNYEMYTRYTFLGLVLGTIPMFYKEVKKNGFSNKYYIIMIVSFIVGISIFFLSGNKIEQITNPNLLQSVLLGVAVAGSSIVPGIDSAVILSSLGLYELYVSSIANMNFPVLIPAAFGLLIGAFIISFIINKLITKCYTLTFSIIFGLFLSIIPTVLNDSCYLGLNINSLVSLLFCILGFGVSTFMGNLKNNIKIFKKIKSYINELRNPIKSND